MQRLVHRILVVVLACGAVTGSALAQSAPKPAPSAEASSVQKGLALADQGHCREALLILRKAAPVAADRQLKLKGGLAIVRCGLALHQVDAVVNALLWLNRDFPSDPDVLYVTTHAYSDLSTHAALQLAGSAPGSVQAHELNAEALESQGKWDEAVAEYNEILKQQPNQPGVHYRLGRIILSKPPTPTTVEDARNEFLAELKIDHNNAGAEYILAELSRQAGNSEEAIEHFSRASKLDASFADAFLGLGVSLNTAGRYAEAIPALETGVRLQPGNPAGHYQLAIAYNRVGRREDAKREAALQKEMAEKLEQEKQKAADPPQ
jgi:tetratricopeptide (TPR) repeat protein